MRSSVKTNPRTTKQKPLSKRAIARRLAAFDRVRGKFKDALPRVDEYLKEKRIETARENARLNRP